MLRKTLPYISLAASLLLLSSCHLVPEDLGSQHNANTGDTTTPNPDSKPDTKPDDSTTPTPRVQGLRLAQDDDSLLTYLRAGMTAQYGTFEENRGCFNCYDNGIFASEPEIATDAAPDSATDSDSKDSVPASETNLIEAGVDEADWLKFDKHNGHLYYSIQPQWYGGWYDLAAQKTETNAEQAHGKIDVFQLESNGTHAPLSSYALNENANQISGLYTAGDNQLVALYAKSEPYDDWRMSYYWRQGKVGLESIDTSNADQLTQQWQVTIDGYLVDSRRVGNQLYLVTRFSPHLQGLEYKPWEEAVVTKNKQLIANADLTDFLPSIHINGQSDKLVPQSRCLVPSAEDEYNTGYNLFTSITRINLDDPTDWQSSCAIATISSLYMNQDALYLTRGYDWHEAKTELHRFDLNSLDYTDSVSVPGSLGWRSDKFRIKEQTLNDEKVLTLITSTRESGSWLHQLFNYQVSPEGKIDWLATLPNETNPAAIGKPGENIHGARISGNTAYVVTFLTTDPLYKIDLSNPSNPTLVGELEIPGFSDYLHPVNDNLLIGVGYQTLSNKDDSGQTRMVKVSLYDVSGNDPEVISEQFIGLPNRSNSTAAAYDHHAFSFLDYEDGTYRFTVPVISTGWDPLTQTYQRLESLSLFEIDTNTIGSNDISAALQLTFVPQEGYYYYSANPRSIIFGNSIHFATGSALASALWATPQTKQLSNITNNKPPIYYIDVGAID